MRGSVGKTILIVDDEPDVVTYLKMLLQDNGYEILIAKNGKEAYEIALDRKPDLISLDISMPKQSGTKAFRNLQENDLTKNIPVLIVSGVDPSYEKFISTRKQVDAPAGYFEKPINRDKFLLKIKEIFNEL